MKNLGLIRPLLALYLTTSFVTLTAFDAGAAAASGGVGNTGGGNARVCFKDQATAMKVRNAITTNGGWIPDDFITAQYVKSVKMLDSIEASAPRGDWDHRVSPELIQIDPSASVSENFKKIVQRFQPLAPGLVAIIKDSSQHLKTVVEAASGIERIDDVNSRVVNEDNKCMRVTVIAQSSGEAKSYISVDPRFLNLPTTVFSNFERAVARLHEFIYYFARRQEDAADSDSTRQLVGTMVSQNIQLSDVVMSFMNLDVQHKIIHLNLDENTPGIDHLTYAYEIFKELKLEFQKSVPADMNLVPPYYSSSAVDPAYDGKCTALEKKLKLQALKWYSEHSTDILNKFQQVATIPTLNYLNPLFKQKFGRMIDGDRLAAVDSVEICKIRLEIGDYVEVDSMTYFAKVIQNRPIK